MTTPGTGGAGGRWGNDGALPAAPSFASGVAYGALENPQSVALGDLNGDGSTDIVATSWGHDSGLLGNVRALLGNGDGTFAESTSGYARNVARAVSVALGDLTGDGRLDLVVASSGYVGPVLNYGGLRVLPNDGNGALAASVPYDASTSANFVALGDLNGDAKTDVAVANTSLPGRAPIPGLGPGSVRVLLNDGTGALTAPVDLAPGADYTAVAMGDLNGDGKWDIAAAGDNGVSVFLNRGDGSFAAPTVQSLTAGSIALGDLNGDGSADLVVTTGIVYCGAPTQTSCDGAALGPCGEGVSVLLNHGDGSFAVPIAYAAGAAPRAVALADLNGDGKTDAVVVNSSAGTVTVLVNDGSGGFAAPLGIPVGDFPVSVALADLNGDHKTDLVVANQLLGGRVSVLLNTSP